MDHCSYLPGRKITCLQTQHLAENHDYWMKIIKVNLLFRPLFNYQMLLENPLGGGGDPISNSSILSERSGQLRCETHIPRNVHFIVVLVINALGDKTEFLDIHCIFLQ